MENNKEKIDFRFLLPLGIILVSFFFYFMQLRGIISFDDNFLLSRNIFGSTYDGVPLADVSFFEKLEYIETGTTFSILVVFIISSGLLIWYAWKWNKHYIVFVALTAISFLLFFFPEGLFIRSRFLILFFSLIIGGGATVIILFSEKCFNRISFFQKNPKLIKYISSIIIIIIFIPILYESTKTYADILAPYDTNHLPFTTFEPYEYEAAKWLRENIPPDTIVISDPYSINLITQISGLKPPFERKWVEEKEYPQESLAIMSGMKNNFFLSQNEEEKLLFMNKLLDENNSQSAVVIFNGRTLQWLYANDLIVVTYAGMEDLHLYFIQDFINSYPMQQIYSKENNIYIFKLDLMDYNTFAQIISDSETNNILWRSESDGIGTIESPIISVDDSNIQSMNSFIISPDKGKKGNWRVYANIENGNTLDWSDHNILSFFWYGKNSGKDLGVLIGTIEENWNHSLRFDLRENWEGYERIDINLNEFYNNTGSPDLTQVTRIGFTMYDNVHDTRKIGDIFLAKHISSSNNTKQDLILDFKKIN